MSPPLPTARSLAHDAMQSAAWTWERAQGDYQRFKGAYDKLCAEEPENDIGRTLIGMDLERALRVLQELARG